MEVCAGQQLYVMTLIYILNASERSDRTGRGSNRSSQEAHTIINNFHYETNSTTLKKISAV